VSSALDQPRPGAWGAGKWAGRKISQAEVPAITSGHFLFLKRRPGGVAAVLTYSDLSRLDLSHATLTEAKMTGACLVGAKLTASILDRASLFAADLRHCDLRYASLMGADVRGASLKDADMSNSVLDGADFRSAVMFKNGQAIGDSASGLRSNHAPGGVDFSGASLKGASFKGAMLKDVSFRNALLQGTQFKGAALKNACLKGAVLSDVVRKDLPFSDEELADCLMPPGENAVARMPALLQMVEEHELWVKSGSAAGRAAVLDKEDLRPLIRSLQRRELTALSARGVVAVSVEFTGCQLQGANFEGADLRDANFMKADLRGANFRGADLSHASFDEADLGTLVLNGGTVVPVNLQDAVYHEEQFSKAMRAAS
jgi:uncharacterized protein YjbI with pentapeptide repeats